MSPLRGFGGACVASSTKISRRWRCYWITDKRYYDAIFWITKLLSMSAAANAKHAAMSSASKAGYCLSSSSVLSPALKNSKTVCTVMRCPRMVGLPLQRPSSMVILSVKYCMGLGFVQRYGKRKRPTNFPKICPPGVAAGLICGSSRC
jgi:hypothetical protein